MTTPDCPTCDKKYDPNRVFEFLEEDEECELLQVIGEGDNEKIFRFVSSKILAERHDVGMICREVSKTYDEITMGQLSKPHTRSEYVIERVQELENKACKRAVEEFAERAKEAIDAEREV